MDVRIIGQDHAPVGVAEALLSFGVIQFFAGLLIWLALRASLGERMFRLPVVAALSVLSATFWGLTQIPRGTDAAGCVILAVEAGLLTAFTAWTCRRLLRQLHEGA